MEITESTRNTVITVGTSPVVISEEQMGPLRSVFLATNTSIGGQIIYISTEVEAQVGNGIVIAPNGYYSDAKESGYTPSQKRITAVSNLAGGTLAIHERVLMKVGF